MRAWIVPALAFAVVAGFVVRGDGEAAPRKEAQVQKIRVVVINRPGEAWLKGKPVLEQPLQPHIDYMAKLLKEGKLLMGGPFLDDAGGMSVLEVESLDEAKKIVAADPGVTAKVVSPEIHPWMTAMQRR